jgi:hypothetical protein
MTAPDFDPWAADLERAARDKPPDKPAPAEPLYEQLMLGEPAEQWRPVAGFEGEYEVSDRGNVLSVRQGLLPQWVDSAGYPMVRLGPTRRIVRVHVLVLEAFAGPRPPRMVTRHLNDVKNDNRWPENLAWGTSQENSLDIVRNGNHPDANKTHCPKGHPYDAENTYVIPGPSPSRDCKECSRERGRAYRARYPERVRANARVNTARYLQRRRDATA